VSIGYSYDGSNSAPQVREEVYIPKKEESESEPKIIKENDQWKKNWDDKSIDAVGAEYNIMGFSKLYEDMKNKKEKKTAPHLPSDPEDRRTKWSNFNKKVGDYIMFTLG
jgi:hypothetical protein